VATCQRNTAFAEDLLTPAGDVPANEETSPTPVNEFAPNDIRPARGQAYDQGLTINRVAIEGNKLIAEFNDLWEQPLRYDMPLNMEAANYTIRSAGRDHKFETRDDIQVDYSTGASRNDASIPTATPAEAAPTQTAPIGEALQRIEIQGRDGRTYLVVINR